MYSLFIAGDNGAWDGEVFSLPVDRFCEYTDEDTQDRYKLPLTDERRKELVGLPCLFAYEGLHDVHIGQLTSISSNNGRQKIRFELSKVSIPAGTFESIQRSLGIDNHWELNRTHWAIKDVNLAKVLMKAGIEVPAWMKSTAEVGELAPRGDVPSLPETQVEFIKRRGSGAYGTVWEARETLLERRIAVKFLTSTDEAYDQEALLKEARSLARISHPNLVTVFGAAQLRHPETRFAAPAILMEYIDGVDLDDWWNVIHDPEQVLRVALQIVDGVTAMHNGKVIHGDLHPKNVMVIGDSLPKIIDWRYQDSELRRPTTYVRTELDAEVRRVYDLVDSLLDKQNVALEAGRAIAVAGGSLLDLRARIRIMEAGLVDLGDRRGRTLNAPLRNKAVSIVAQYLYSDGPTTREAIQSGARRIGLTRVGVNFAIDLGLEDKVFESVDIQEPDGGYSAISITNEGRRALRYSLTDGEIYLTDDADS
jgi:tRNA A-37 threonylcarbamoyl transferase component Bud32